MQDPKLEGVDWAAKYYIYRPLLARISTRQEFGDVLHGLLSELGTSHLYVSGGDFGQLDLRSHDQVEHLLI